MSCGRETALFDARGQARIVRLKSIRGAFAARRRVFLDLAQARSLQSMT